MSKRDTEIGREFDTHSTGVREAHSSEADLYRSLPSVNEVMLTAAFETLIEMHGRERVINAAREILADLRRQISAGELSRTILDQKLASLADTANAALQGGPHYSLRPVINATGVILHTNLGRAPLSEEAIRHVAEIARGYSNLELDLETGERSRRDVHVESLMLRVIGVAIEDADCFGVVVVNNCAAATLLTLNSLAEKREVVVSRGELVEIGGGFRIPEILEKSGAVLKEVGTTNRTRLADYEAAVSEHSALLLRVHQSNFSIEGFTERPALTDLVALSRMAGVPLFEDQGTGLVEGLERFGIRDQPTLRASIAAGVDLVAASGDKLLGGPQCGLLIGRKDLTDRIRRNPLLRAFRVDKLGYAALEGTLLQHLSGGESATPLLRMISTPAAEIEHRCQALARSLKSLSLRAGVIPVQSVAGGGTAPNATVPSSAVMLRHARLTAAELLSALRKLNPPIIARIADDAVLLDLRTVFPDTDELISRLLQQL